MQRVFPFQAQRLIARTPTAPICRIDQQVRSAIYTRQPNTQARSQLSRQQHESSRSEFHTTSTENARAQNMAHQTFPADIPVPKDDGAYDHLSNFTIPSDLALPVARDPTQVVNLSSQSGLTVLFCYPRTGRPNETVPDEWNAIPGARGCTPQACSFRDNFTQLKQLGVSQVYGISTQSPSYQAEVHDRLHLPYDLLSDQDLKFQQALQLPTFDWEGGKVLRRSSIVVEGGKVVKWFYPVFPPDKGVDDVIAWLKERQ